MQKNKDMSNIMEQRLYIAAIYGYSLRPEPWQRGYTWYDHVADSDFSFRFGLEVPDGTGHGKLLVSEEEARGIYSEYKSEIESVGIDEFYDRHFGKYYK